MKNNRCSWAKRENFRKAFDNFDYKKIAKYNEDKLSELAENKGIVRNKLKIVALVENAVAFMEIQKKLDHLTNTSGNLWITNELLIIGKI